MSETDPSPKIELKIRVGNAPNFCQIGCFFTFFEKKVENAPKTCTLGAFLRKMMGKKNLTDQPKYSEIPLEGNTSIFFFFFFLPLGQISTSLHRLISVK